MVLPPRETNPFASKTLSFDDLARPPVAPVAAELRRFAFRLGLSGTAFALNGILRLRFWVQRHKLWEYARGVACLLDTVKSAAETGEGTVKRRVLDFGGGATLPVFYLAHRGWQVFSLDINPRLTDWTNRVARQRGWELCGSTHNLTQAGPPAPEPGSSQPPSGQFDAAISFSVLEDIPRTQQPLLLERLASRLKPGGVLALTFDFGPEARMENALRGCAEVERLVAATGLTYLGGHSFLDTGERFVLDKRHPDRRFTFASLFLRKPA